MDPLALISKILSSQTANGVAQQPQQPQQFPRNSPYAPAPFHTRPVQLAGYSNVNQWTNAQANDASRVLACSLDSQSASTGIAENAGVLSPSSQPSQQLNLPQQFDYGASKRKQEHDPGGSLDGNPDEDLCEKLGNMLTVGEENLDAFKSQAQARKEEWAALMGQESPKITSTSTNQPTPLVEAPTSTSNASNKSQCVSL